MVVAMNSGSTDTKYQITVDGKVEVSETLPSHSINTFVIPTTTGAGSSDSASALHLQ